MIRINLLPGATRKAARRMLAGMREFLTAAGKKGFVVDPDDTLRLAGGPDSRATVFTTLGDALSAAAGRRASDG